MGTILLEIKQSEDRVRQLQNEAEQIRFNLAVEQAVLTRLRAVTNESLADGRSSAGIPGSLASHIEEALVTFGRSMTVSAITEAIEKAGVTTQSASGLQPSVASALSRRKDLFVKAGKGEWDLVARQKRKESHEDPHKQAG